jgi:hypothetical protein
MTIMTAIGTACFLAGVVLGMIFNYIVETKPLLAEYKALVEIIYSMKRQGFVPQFEIKQRKPLNPASDVVEY